MPVTALPTPPSRSDPANFAARADAFHGALPTFATELNALQSDVVTRQSAVATNATAAAASATAAQAAQAAAEGAALAQVWVSGTNYTAGQQVYSPTNNLNYRCIVSVSPSTVDPISDSTHWGNSTSGMASLAGAETLTNKTLNGANNTFSNIPTSKLTGAMAIANGGTAATTATAARANLGAQAELGFIAGTRVLFAQAAAPTGWTRDVSDAANNRMLRVVSSGGGGTGGSMDPTFCNVVPSHTHGFTTGGVSADHTHGIGDNGHSHTQVGHVAGAFGYSGGGGTAGVGIPYSANNTTSSNGTGIWTGGTSTNHSHSGSTDNGSSQTNWTPRYIDMIICTKQ